jgi:hypothetical protein
MYFITPINREKKLNEYTSTWLRVGILLLLLFLEIRGLVGKIGVLSFVSSFKSGIFFLSWC